MYFRYYKFAKLVVKIESTVPITESVATEPFLSEETPWSYRVCVSSDMDGEFEIDGYGSLRQEENTFHLRLNGKVYDSVSVLQIFSFLPMRQMLFANNMVVLHASYVLHHGQAVLFSGNSGIGKSTQASLWQDYLGAQIVNGDRALIYLDDGIVYVSGWFQSGTSGICNRGLAPLKAIVFLEQGSGNEVSVMTGVQAFKQLVCQCSYETDNQQHILKVTEIAADIVDRVPVYLYNCNKEPAAAELLRKYLYG